MATDDIELEEMYTAEDLAESASVLYGANGANGHQEQVDERVFMNAYQFIEEVIDAPPPLWGSDDVTLLPAGGLALLAGRPGCGKTTFILDLACHLACGMAYPPVEDDKGPTPWPAHKPLRIALIENEGPREMFRGKLEQKLGVFPHNIDDLGGRLMVQTWRWGSYTFADEDARIKTALELDAAGIDLVIGDPLGTLGPAGVGSPQDTREFVAMLKPLGLGLNRGFLFLHHFRERVERSEDELARISGAWGGHLDTLLTLSAARSADQARLAYPKLRWARVQTPTPIIMGRVWNTSSYVALAEENDVSMLEPIVYAELAKARSEKTGALGQGWMTGDEIRLSLKAAGGQATRRVDIIAACEGAPHIFVERTGDAAKALGKQKRARLWGLKEWDPVDEMPDEDPDDIRLPL